MAMLRRRVLFFFAGIGILFATQAMASLEDISYPISELGNCENQEACFAYCNDPLHFDACISFAEANQLLTDEEIQTYQTAEQALAENGGPGGCADQASCEAFCSDVSNMEACLSFARENGMMSEEELAEATQVLEAIQSGASLPGGCTNQDTCEAYCSETDHMEECLNFASAAGIMSEEELQEAQSMMEKMQSGEMPGGCDSEEACMSYCLDPVNRDECASFFGTQTETGEVFEEVVPFYEEGTEYEHEGGTEYEYEGGSYDESYDEDHYDEPSGFEDFGPEDIPLDLESAYEGDAPDSTVTPYDEIEVTPETTESETGGEMDASFIESIQKFISGVVTKLKI